ncbi:helix-turn-helix domain-containing protein [Limibacillus sp. MBR-115]|jgi:transcriptional regulator GlxA family with amidase domain|uniref:GlxA family transcriptional regulator n=1 Tax=Limibacillus sp. MBR-115 TaxID=3156465 RepID=UPI003397A3DF
MNDAAARSVRHHRVGLVLFDGFDLRGYANLAECLAVLNARLVDDFYECIPIGSAWSPVKARCGTKISVKARVGEGIDYRLILVLGERNAISAETGALPEWLRRAQRFGSELGGVGYGTWLLAQSGVLDDGPVTVPPDSRESFRETFSVTLEAAQSSCSGKGIITAAGSSGATDMMLAWLRRRHGDLLAALAAKDLGLTVEDFALPGAAPEVAQRLGLTHPALTACIELMERNVETPLSKAALAKASKISLRQLERLFHQHVGMPPKVFYRHLRLKKAHQLLLHTPLSVMEVALATGFQSAGHFSRVYKEAFGSSPSQLRRTISTREDPRALIALV